MFCGSCMHDNTWARSLMDAGEEVSLIPTYTPIRVDEQNESLEKVFFGGINVYLNQKVPGWRYLPRFLTHWLDHPRVISWATRRSVSNDASQLGTLTLSMVRGELGPHRAAIRELDAYISEHLKPDVVIFSNALLVGAVHELKERFSGPIYCVLQGDDVFLDSLDPKYRSQVIKLISERAQAFDGFLTHSHFYKEYMADYLNLPPDKFSVIPLGIDLTDHDGQPTLRNNPELTIGYFARIAPEKGLHHLVDAFAILKESLPEAKLKIGGFLGPQHQSYFQESLQRAAKYSGDITYIGSPETHQEKIAFLKSIDVLSVPTEFLEPKGLYVLEALGQWNTCRAATTRSVPRVNRSHPGRTPRGAEVSSLAGRRLAENEQCRAETEVRQTRLGECAREIWSVRNGEGNDTAVGTRLFRDKQNQ